MLNVKTVENIFFAVFSLLYFLCCIFFAVISPMNIWNPTIYKSISIVTYANRFVDSRAALSFMVGPYDQVRVPRSVIGQWV